MPFLGPSHRLPSIWQLIEWGLVSDDGPGNRDTTNDMTEQQIAELL